MIQWWWRGACEGEANRAPGGGTVGRWDGGVGTRARYTSNYGGKSGWAQAPPTPPERTVYVMLIRSHCAVSFNQLQQTPDGWLSTVLVEVQHGRRVVVLFLSPLALVNPQDGPV